MRDPAERPGPGLHILVSEQQAGAGLRQGRQGDQQRAVGRQHHGGHVDHQQRSAPRLGQLHVSAVQFGFGQRVSARFKRYEKSILYSVCARVSVRPGTVTVYEIRREEHHLSHTPNAFSLIRVDQNLPPRCPSDHVRAGQTVLFGISSIIDFHDFHFDIFQHFTTIQAVYTHINIILQTVFEIN